MSDILDPTPLKIDWSKEWSYRNPGSGSGSGIPEGYHNTTGVTATAEHVLTGDVFVDRRGNRVNGKMPDNGPVQKYINALNESSVDIPAGYTSGGTVDITDDLVNALSEI